MLSRLDLDEILSRTPDHGNSYVSTSLPLNSQMKTDSQEA